MRSPWTACGSTASSGAGASASAAVSGASGSAAASGSAGTGTPGQVTVTVTDADGCVASPDTVPAGQVTFVISNLDAVGVTEVELVADQRIVGERENLAPGFDSTFSARLDGAATRSTRPGASTERSAFTVTGQAGAQDADLAALLTQATKDYATYVDDQITFLLVPVQGDGDRDQGRRPAAAQAAYIKARPFYERIEPVAESFPDLDPAIDLRIGDVEQGTEWTGFHPIEQGLFEKQSTEGSAPSPTVWWSTSSNCSRRPRSFPGRDRGRRRRRLPGVRDRQRLRHPARRGPGVEDHRRGGGLLQDRPAGLRGQRGGLVAGSPRSSRRSTRSTRRSCRRSRRPSTP